MRRSPKAFALIFIFLFLFSIFKSALAADLSVVINEVCWMGDTNRTSNEWIELYNDTPSAISLAGWILKIDDTEIKLNGVIPAKGYYLISRDKTKSANLFFNKALKNTGNKIILYYNNKTIIDEAAWASGWPAGDNKTKQTMERRNPLLPGNDKNNWQTSVAAGGTPGAQNSSGATKGSEKSQVVNNEIIDTDPATESREQTASLINNKNQNDFSFGSGLLVIFISLLSGGTIFLIKKSLGKNQE
ncbi:MAG: lamin tail domain-containing protein [Candidatus Paceibacterota bacterium]